MRVEAAATLLARLTPQLTRTHGHEEHRSAARETGRLVADLERMLQVEGGLLSVGEEEAATVAGLGKQIAFYCDGKEKLLVEADIPPWDARKLRYHGETDPLVGEGMSSN